MASSEELGYSTTSDPDRDDHTPPHSYPDPDPDPDSLHEAFQHLNSREEEEEEEEEEAVEEDYDENASDNERENERGKESERESGRESEGERKRERDGSGEERHGENCGQERELDNFGYENNDNIDNNNYNNKSRDRFGYPVRPEAEDCAFYIKTGSCKYGLHCKYNHPIRRKNAFGKEKPRDKEDSSEKASQTECKYYLRTGGCKFGKACRYNHTRAKTSVEAAPELNFLGLPIRPGEKECPYYMRTGSCKFAAGCRFNHPDPTAVGGNDLPIGYADDGSASLQNAFQPTVASWSAPGTLMEASLGPQFIPILYPPNPGVPSQNTEWKSYEVPLYPLEKSMQPPPTFSAKNSATELNVYKNSEPHILTNEYPDRPGQPECSYYLKTGDCKFKSSCKYHHPKNLIQNSTPVALSDKGLPLRPDRHICSYYNRYGICKFGPACKFDHPIHWTPLNITGLDESPFDNSTGTDGHGTVANNTRDAPIQQSV